MRDMSNKIGEGYGVLFDLDGVIVDSGECHKKSFFQIAHEEGIEMTDELFIEGFGRRNDEIFPMYLGRPLSQEKLDDLAERKEHIYREFMRESGVHPLPGVIEFIKDLKENGFKIAIGSSTCLKNIEFVLSSLGILDSFDAIVSAEDVTIGKPNPRVFVLGAERVGVVPKNCVVVEDAVAGVQAAKNGNMKALAVTTTRIAEDLYEADLIVDTLNEVDSTTIKNLFLFSILGDNFN
jgi:beta-phosphoglucomutase family hydrolase